jgi:hypothetical protein
LAKGCETLCEAAAEMLGLGSEDVRRRLLKKVRALRHGSSFVV